MIVLILIVLGFGLVTSLLFLRHSDIVWKVVYILFFVFTLVVIVLLFISDPGIIENRGLGHDVEDSKNLTCRYCNTLKTQNARHCYDCGVCIQNYDHHCDVIGKCIGGGNICLFYLFVVSLPSFIIASIVYISSSV